MTAQESSSNGIRDVENKGKKPLSCCFLSLVCLPSQSSTFRRFKHYVFTASLNLFTTLSTLKGPGNSFTALLDFFRDV